MHGARNAAPIHPISYGRAVIQFYLNVYNNNPTLSQRDFRLGGRASQHAGLGEAGSASLGAGGARRRFLLKDASASEQMKDSAR
jgi:hypothetical protein